MGGIQSGGIGSSQNVFELKQVLKNTTKVTKVFRGTEQERPEDVTHEVALAEKDGSDDD